MYELNEVAGNLRIFCHGWCWKLQSQWQRHNTACSHLAVLWSSAHKYCVITGPGRHKYNIDIISSLATFMKAYTWPQIANIHSADAFPWKDINSFSFWSCYHGIQVGLWLVSFNNKRSDWLAYLDEVEGHAHKLYFFAMATSAKRSRFTTEEILSHLEFDIDFDSDRGGMASGKESDIDRRLMDFDEEPRWVRNAPCRHGGNTCLQAWKAK